MQCYCTTCTSVFESTHMSYTKKKRPCLQAKERVLPKKQVTKETEDFFFFVYIEKPYNYLQEIDGVL